MDMEPDVRSATWSENSRSFANRPYTCQLCSRVFRRHDHLRRHLNVHTGDQKYACPCGEIFVRRDHLAHHLKSCKTSRLQREQHPRWSRGKVTRSKRACDQCASAKSKCNSEEPCRRCQTRSDNCTYTRDGYVDPYLEYRIENAAVVESAVEDTEACATDPSASVASARVTNLEYASVNDKGSSEAWPQDGHNPPLPVDVLGPFTSILQSKAMPHEGGSGEPHVFDPHPVQSNASFDLDSDFWGNFTSDAWVFDPAIEVGPKVSEAFSDWRNGPNNIVNLAEPYDVPERGYTLEQCDPVEMKCLEIRALLQNGTPEFPAGLIDSCLTRAKILHCHNLYGKHFQYHFPFLHAPTHKFTETPPILLLAMVLAGAHYAPNVLELSNVFKIAQHLMLVVQMQQCEINLQAPELFTLQACLIITVLLACSRNAAANQAWSIYFPRVLSMCERMGGFRGEVLSNYQSLTLETFDWHDWVRTESLRRVACQIFTQDAAKGIFFDTPASLSPLSTSMTLPCHESAWEAETAGKCLEELQRLPQQLSLSQALTKLNDFPDPTSPQLEISGYGMFVLVTAIHTFIFYLLRADTESLFPIQRTRRRLNRDALDATGAQIHMGRLQRRLSRSTVEAISDTTIGMHGGPAFRHLNSLLNAWRTLWDKRQFRDIQSDGKTFCASPLPFYLLAKLFLLLGLIDQQDLADEHLCMPKIRAGDVRVRLIVQEKITSWLNALRTEVTSEGHPTAQNASEEDSSRLSLLVGQRAC